MQILEKAAASIGEGTSARAKSSDARGGRQTRRRSEPMDHGGAGFAQHERRRAAAARRRLAHLAGAVAEPAPTLRLEPCAAHLHPGTAVVVGGMVLDVTASPAPGASLRRGSSTPGVVRQNPGGVGRNIAEGIARLVGPHGTPPLLIAAVGDDLAGRALIDAWRAVGADPRGVRVCAAASTPVVTTVLDHDGEVAASVADTRTAETGVDPSWISSFADSIGRATVCVVDGNCTPECINHVVECTQRVVGEWANGEQKPIVWFEPVSVTKSVRANASLAKIDYASPNAAECRAMANATRHGRGSNPRPMDSAIFEFTSAEAAVAEMRDDVEVLLDAGVGAVVLTLGALGCVLCRGRGGDWTHVPALKDGPPLRSLVGAGDALVAGACAALAAGRDDETAVCVGVALARRAAEVDGAVPAGRHSLRSLERDVAGTLASVRTVNRRRGDARRESVTSGCG